MEEKKEFEFDEVLEQFKNGKNLTGKDGLLAPRSITEGRLNSELLVLALSLKKFKFWYDRISPSKITLTRNI